MSFGGPGGCVSVKGNQPGEELERVGDSRIWELQESWENKVE